MIAHFALGLDILEYDADPEADHEHYVLSASEIEAMTPIDLPF